MRTRCLTFFATCFSLVPQTTVPQTITPQTIVPQTIAPRTTAVQAVASRRVIELVADADDRFRLPGQKEQVLFLKAGEEITMRITAKFGGARGHDGSVHGIFVRELRTQGWNARLKEGTQELQLAAPSEPGEYSIECTVFCGPAHDKMRLKMVVEP